MVWHNELTGKPAFMVHAIIAQKLHIKKSPDDKEQLINNVDEVRKFLYPFARRMVTPENVLVAPYEEGAYFYLSVVCIELLTCCTKEILRCGTIGACSTDSLSIRTTTTSGALARCIKSILRLLVRRPDGHDGVGLFNRLQIVISLTRVLSGLLTGFLRPIVPYSPR
jgi:hypothetical protein